MEKTAFIPLYIGFTAFTYAKIIMTKIYSRLALILPIILYFSLYEITMRVKNILAYIYSLIYKYLLKREKGNNNSLEPS